MTTTTKRTRANRQGDPYQLKDGSWRATYYVPRPDGTSQRRYVRAATKTEARRKRDPLQAAADRGEIATGTAGPITMATWLDDWLDSRRGSLADTTWLEYERCVRLHLRPAIGHHRVADLRPSHVRRLLGKLQEIGKSSQTRCHIYNRLNAALRDAVREGIITVPITENERRHAQEAEHRDVWKQRGRTIETLRPDRSGRRDRR